MESGLLLFPDRKCGLEWVLSPKIYIYYYIINIYIYMYIYINHVLSINTKSSKM